MGVVSGLGPSRNTSLRTFRQVGRRGSHPPGWLRIATVSAMSSVSVTSCGSHPSGWLRIATASAGSAATPGCWWQSPFGVSEDRNAQDTPRRRGLDVAAALQGVRITAANTPFRDLGLCGSCPPWWPWRAALMATSLAGYSSPLRVLCKIDSRVAQEIAFLRQPSDLSSQAFVLLSQGLDQQSVRFDG